MRWWVAPPFGLDRTGDMTTNPKSDDGKANPDANPDYPDGPVDGSNVAEQIPDITLEPGLPNPNDARPESAPEPDQAEDRSQK